jgi:methylmalonyl-CoA/ethylmalonyl-CoA epimerase
VDRRLLLEQAAPSALVYLQVNDVRARIEELRADGVEIIGEPQVIFSHTDDTLGPAGTDEWMGFIRDSEGNTVGLVSHEPRHDP